MTRGPNRALALFAAVVTCSVWPLATVLWLRTGETAFAASLFLLGLSLGPLLAVYAFVRRSRKQAARRAVLFAGGSSIVAFAVFGRANLDLEGCFMLLLKGTMGAAVGHTLATVVVGPVIFGRFLCGWGCWRAMVLECLPFAHSPGRRGGAWRFLPLAGLATSLCAAAVCVFALGHHPGGVPGAMHGATLGSIAGGFAIYYAASIGLACALGDRRAFCKYLCPTSAILSVTSRLSLLKMEGDRRRCDQCGACSRVCPMDIDIARFAAAGQRITSGQCILCQRCAHACPKGVLRLTAGFDI